MLLGGEVSYDGLYDQLNDIYRTDYHPFIVSLHVGHAFVFGRFSFTQQFAWYVIKSYPFNENDFFQRYAVFWQFGKLINVGFSLKAHGHVAENMDVRIGVTF